MPLAPPTNCWTTAEDKFLNAVANSAAFQTLVEAVDEVAALERIFGKRLTHTKFGRAWTADELAELRHYAQVYSSPDGPYGKHLVNNACYKPHGTMIVVLARLVPATELVDPGEDRTGLTETHDRDWHNIVGDIADDIAEWLIENGGYSEAPWDVDEYGETPATSGQTQGCWQGAELIIAWREL
jgi:hypothetical protein